MVLVHGPDVQLLDDTLAALTRGLCPDTNAAIFDREILDGREVTISIAVQSAMIMPVMAQKRLVAVRHCQALAPKGVDVLADYCANPNPAACLLLLADESLTAARDRKDHWLLGVVPGVAVVTLPSRHGPALEQWLRRRATAEGITLSEEAARLLVQWVGDEGAALLGEVRKAALASGPDNHTVGVKEVNAVVGEHRVSGVFDLTRAVERRDVGLALRTLESLLAIEEPLLLLAMLTREVRTAWTIRDAVARGQSLDQLARTLRRPLSVVQAHASVRQSADAEAQVLRRCWAAETRLKSGGEPRAELSALVVALCGR